MASLSVTSSAVQYGATQRAVLQARRTAEQAQQTANSIQAQARDAWSSVERAETKAQAVDARSDQANSTAAQAQQNLATASNGGQLQLASVAKNPSSPTYAAGTSSFSPATNSQGQRLGRLINITA